MKNRIIFSLLIILLMILCTNKNLISQIKGYGFKGGVTFSYFTPDISYSNVNISTGTGFNAGIFADVYNKGNFTVSAELYFNKKNASFNFVQPNYVNYYFPYHSVDFKISYLDYGVPFKYNLIKNNFSPYIYLEPRLNFYLGIDMSTPNDTIAQTYKDLIKENIIKFGFGITAGMGADIYLNKKMSLLFEIQYSPDYYDTFKSDEISVTGSSLEIRTGLRFY